MIVCCSATHNDLKYLPGLKEDARRYENVLLLLHTAILSIWSFKERK